MTAETSAARIRSWLPNARAAVAHDGQFHVLAGAGALLDDIERVLAVADDEDPGDAPAAAAPAVCLDPCPSHLFRTWCVLPADHDGVLHSNGKGVSWGGANAPAQTCGALPPESIRDLFPARPEFRCLRAANHSHPLHDDGHGVTWADRHVVPAAYNFEDGQ